MVLAAAVVVLTVLMVLDIQVHRVVAQESTVEMVLQELQTQVGAVEVLTIITLLFAMVVQVVQVTQQLLIGVNYGTTLRIS
jgi:hypothetical protein